MNNIEIVLYKNSSKYFSPQKYLLKENVGLTISENDYVFIQVITDHALNENTFLWLSDYQMDLVFEKKIQEKYHYYISSELIYSVYDKDKFSAYFIVNNQSILFSKLFLNNYGFCDIELEIIIENKIKYEKICSIEVLSEKIEDVNILLEYLFEKDFFFWNIISLLKNPATQAEKVSENILWRLISIDKYVKQFISEFIINVETDKFYKILPTNELKTWQDNDTINEKSLLWLVDNLNELEIADIYNENHFIIRNRPYKSNSIMSEYLLPDTNVYENQIIHWFINELYLFIDNSKEILLTKVANYKDENNTLKEKVFRRYFKRILVIIQDLENDLVYIKHKLDLSIPVSVTEISSFNNQRITAKPHYYNMYLNILDWSENKQVNFFPDLLFAGLKDISKLYEVFCLFKIIDSLTNDLGFKEDDEFDKQDFVKIFKNENIFNLNNTVPIKYSFTKSELKLKLYYECLPPNITTIISSGKKGLRPDFVLEIIKGDDKPIYLILDAKYKRIDTVEKYEYSELCLKYLHGLGPKNGGVFNAIGLIILNPIANSNTSFYHSKEYNIFSSKKSFPFIGRIEVSANKTQSQNLSTFLSQVMSLIF